MRAILFTTGDRIRWPLRRDRSIGLSPDRVQITATSMPVARRADIAGAPFVILVAPFVRARWS